MTFDVNGATVVVSGASQGLGMEFANQLHQQGANVLLLARSRDKMKGIEKIHNDNKVNDSQWTRSFGIDLSEPENYKQLMDWVKKHKIVPDVLICCAGSSKPKLFTELTIEEIDNGIDVNYKATIYLLHFLVPLMKLNRRNKRHIVLLSSAVAFYSFIGYSQYSPMKSALRALGDSLTHELNPFGIFVHTVFPGNFDSEGYMEENLTKPSITMDIEGGSKPITVERCSQIILNAIGFTKSTWRSILWPNGQRYVFTDFLSWILFTFGMGFGPRDYFGVEVLFGFLGLIVARFVDMFHEYSIKQWFKKRDKCL